jgi:YD repeat-containing protein
VQLNGAAYETYSYDANGNRLTLEKPSGTTTATYDDQDRLLTFGPWAYTYTPNGELLTKLNATTGEAWAYAYDVFGNLKRVDLPSGDVVEYLVDGQNRRVGKKRNGTLVKQWLYEDQLHPVAELDGAGNLVSRFVWASRKNAPDLVESGGVTYRVRILVTNRQASITAVKATAGIPSAVVSCLSGTVRATSFRQSKHCEVELVWSPLPVSDCLSAAPAASSGSAR